MSEQVNPICSFCGKHRDEVSRMIAGPGVFVCDECVDTFNDILSDDDDANDPEQASG